ncbi:spore germination protein (amino acid permease) [Paenibacillus castaneae]|uniref:GerAB/ArcD/ProY family transporter n=1 Tax=Paenibacillus castaneae TaxID=474957 RepID=UPI000C9CF56C|nr:endospore germination permease [Paenibacillus castaneae]NIK75819.1 spore germination protein (amino acid permease) [Paenibacillus castaneae]
MSSGRGITVSQGFMLMMLTAGLTNHVMIIPVLLDKSGRDAWITVIVGAILFIPWVLLVYGTMKKLGNRSLKAALDESRGKWARWLVLGLISLYLFSFACYTLKEVIDWTKSTYLLQTPVAITSIVLLLLCVVTAHKGARTIGTTGGILLPVVVILGIFVSFANMKYKHYSFLQPVLENGFTPVLHGLPAIFGGLTQFILAIFLRPHLPKSPKLITIAIFHIVLVFLTLGPTMAGISEFGPEEMKLQRYPAYEQWRLVKLGKFIEHVDFLSIFQWLSGAYISISLCMFLAAEHILSPARRLVGILVFSVLIGVVCISPLSNLRFYYLMEDYFLAASAIFTTVLIILMFFLIRKPDCSRSGKGENLP